mgnify:CR=1 FL=1
MILIKIDPIRDYPDHHHQTNKQGGDMMIIIPVYKLYTYLCVCLFDL